MPETRTFEPDNRIHAPNAFICGTGIPGCGVSYYEKPERVIAGQILEDVGDWLGALRQVERRHVPPGVLAAFEAAHEAAAGWTEWLDRKEGRTDA